MNRLTKVIYFSVLLIVAFVQMILGNLTLGIGLVALIVCAIPVFEKRENRRHFYRALRKLYVCVDINAYTNEVQKLKKNTLFIKFCEAELLVLQGISLYYSNQKFEAKSVLSNVACNNDLAFWKSCYLQMIDLNDNNVATEAVEAIKTFVDLSEMMQTVPTHFKEIARQRVMVLELRQKDLVPLAEIEAMRDQVTHNLLIAELTQEMAQASTETRIKNYYQRGVINLSKGLTL